MRIPVALVQLNSRDDKAANIAAAEAAIVAAAEGGARLVALPELWTYLGPEAGNRANAEQIPGPVTERLGALAARYRLILHGGSMLEAGDESMDGRVYNTAVTFDTTGALVAVYRKIHLFDAEPTARGKPYRESATTAAGDQIVIVTCDGLRLGLATCYDLRFPELFRALALRGAEIVVMPSAFTLETGRDHWEPLLRARAIENGCFMLAPGQCGPRPPDRRTYGHSLVVDPWGDVLAEGPEETPAIVRAELDTDRVAEVRRRIPSLANRRPEVY
ncbi:MAG: carbon-nitrogen hydrolase family protein [Ktedonobacterales bacterium]